MNREELYESLNYVNHSREKRTEMSQLALNNKHLVSPILDIIFLEENPVSSKAAWVLEFVVTKNLHTIFPHMDRFTENIHTLKLESSVRPMAKICEKLILDYFSKSKTQRQGALTENHFERITSSCFDWLIGDFKVAAKAYSMTTLFELGKKYKWIHPELKMILEQNYSSGSAAYKARSRMILKKMKRIGI